MATSSACGWAALVFSLTAAALSTLPALVLPAVRAFSGVLSAVGVFAGVLSTVLALSAVLTLSAVLSLSAALVLSAVLSLVTLTMGKLSETVCAIAAGESTLAAIANTSDSAKIFLLIVIVLLILLCGGRVYQTFKLFSAASPFAPASKKEALNIPFK